MSILGKFKSSALELKNIRCIVLTGILIALDIVLKMFSIKITADLKITFAYLALATIGMLFGPTVGFIAGAVTDIIGFIINSDGGFSPLFTFIEALGAMIYGLFLYGITPVIVSSYNKKNTPLDSVLKVIFGGIITSGLLTLLLCLAGSIVFRYEYDSGMMKIAKVLLNEHLLYVTLIVGFIYGFFFAFIIIMRTKKDSEKTSVESSLRIILSKVSVVIICNLVLTPVAMVIAGYSTKEAVISGYLLRLVKNLIQCPVDCVLLLMILFPILASYKRVFRNKKKITIKTGKNVNTI